MSAHRAVDKTIRSVETRDVSDRSGKRVEELISVTFTNGQRLVFRAFETDAEPGVRAIYDENLGRLSGSVER